MAMLAAFAVCGPGLLTAVGCSGRGLVVGVLFLAGILGVKLSLQPALRFCKDSLVFSVPNS